MSQLCCYICASEWYIKRIWRALFQNTISVNTKIEFAIPIPSLEIMFWKGGLYKCVHIYAHYQIKLSTKTQSLNVALALQAHFLEWHLGKELFISRVFFQNSISADSKIEFAIPRPHSEIMILKRALHKYVSAWAYVHLWKALLQDTI